MLQKRLPDHNVAVTRVETADPPLELTTTRLQEARHELASFTNEFYPVAVRGLASPEEGLIGSAFAVDVAIPLCLSGAGNFYVKDAEGVHRVRVLLTVVPGENRTMVSIAGMPADRRHLATYQAARFKNGLTLLSAIESWMIHGTDNWYLAPSVWDAITPQEQNAILHDILDESRSLSNVYDRNVFKVLRQQLIDSVVSAPHCTDEVRRRVQWELDRFREPSE